jgi:membrane-bound lytic murein transglycosylase D
VGLADLAAMNPAWTGKSVHGGKALPAGVTVWLPQGTLDRARGSAPTAPPTDGSHVVQRGETLTSVAARYGLSVAALRQLNGIPAGTSEIRQGQRLRVADDSHPVHVVRKGDTLFKIATFHGVSLADLLSANALTERTVLRPGQQLRIPRLR